MPGEVREDIDKGGKSKLFCVYLINLRSMIWPTLTINMFFSVILPPSALKKITKLDVPYPLLFNISSKETERKTNCGVLEFSADEGKCFAPYWVIKLLNISCFFAYVM